MTAGHVHSVDILDTLRLRLVDPPDAAVADLERRLPGSPAGPGDLPVLEVRFVEHMPLTKSLWPIGRAGHAQAGDGLVVGHGPGIDRPRCRLRFDALVPAARHDAEPALVCERALGRVPYLVPLVNIALLGLGVLPLHASAVVAGGAGVALAGWRKSGKTEAMLAVLHGGSEPGAGPGANRDRFTGGRRGLIADEWTYVRPDGSLAGLPGPVRLPVAVLGQLGLPSDITGPTTRARLAGAGAAIAGRLALPGPGPVRRGGRAAAALLEGLAAVDVPAARLAGSAGLVTGAPLRLLVLLRPVIGGVGRAREITPDEAAARMTAAHVHHRLDLLDLYWTARYATPHATHPVLDNLAGHESAALAAALAGVRCVELEHPMPVNIAAIRDVLEPLVASVETLGRASGRATKRETASAPAEGST